MTHVNQDYYPDKWVIVEFDSPELGKTQKIFATWNGGYLHGSSWKLSSGNLKVVLDGDYYKIPQESGSVYFLHKNCCGVRYDWQHLLDKFKEVAERENCAFRIVDISELI